MAGSQIRRVRAVLRRRPRPDGCTGRHTGAGKSTAMGLLQRLRDPDAGAIRT